MKPVVFLLALAPGLWLLFRTLTDRLSANPIEDLRTLLDPLLVISNGRVGLDRLSFGR